MTVKKQGQGTCGANARQPPAVSSQRKTRNSEAAFRNLVEVARCVFFILRQDHAIAYCNGFAAELTGYSVDEVSGKDYFETFVPGDVRPEVEEHFRRTLADGSSGEIGHPILTKSGTHLSVVCCFRAPVDYLGEPAVLLTAQDITVHKQTEAALQRRTHDLGERVKELNCLFGLSKLVEALTIDFAGILQGLVDILPAGWQYPEVTCGRIVFENRQYQTYNFRETPWKQAAPIMVHGKRAGVIEVSYLEEKRPSHEGPFLAEERRLLSAIAEQLGRIAERINAEKEYRRERDFAESLIETAPAIVLVLDPKGRILRINPYMEEISGHRIDDVKGADWFTTFLPERTRDRMRSLFVKTIGGRSKWGNVGPIVTRDGREREIEWYDKVLEDTGGNIVGLLAIGQDITDRRKLEKEIVDISTLEQQRIGQELHDGLGQELTGLGYLAETLYCDLVQRGATEVETANRLAEGIERTLEQTRTIAKGLVPVEIEADGLASSLRQLAVQIEHRCDIQCTFVCNEPVPVGDTATAMQMFRIVQEAVSNAVKHARAKRIAIEVKTDETQFSLQIEDDGVGLPADLDRTAGMGLRIMQHRAGVIGATLSVFSAPQGGTIVNCSLPRGDKNEYEESS